MVNYNPKSMLTNQEHDLLWKQLFGESVPGIEKQLKMQVVLTMIERLYQFGTISEEGYKEFLIRTLTEEYGYNIKTKHTGA